MKTPTLDTIAQWVIGLVVLTIIITITLVILEYAPSSADMQQTYDKCCNGSMCSDTYYSQEDKKCHSTFENQVFNFQSFFITLGIGILATFFLTIIVNWINPSQEDKK